MRRIVTLTVVITCALAAVDAVAAPRGVERRVERRHFRRGDFNFYRPAFRGQAYAGYGTAWGSNVQSNFTAAQAANVGLAAR